MVTEKEPIFFKVAFGGLLKHLKSSGFRPVEVAMLECLCSSVMGIKYTRIISCRMQAYVIMPKRNPYLTRVPP